MSPKVFPVLLIILMIGSAISYGVAKDWRHCVYWSAAAVLNISITF